MQKHIFTCQICGFTTRYVNQHLLLHIDDIGKNIKLGHFQYMWKHVQPDGEVWYSCRSCDFQTKVKISVRRHELIHRNVDDIFTYKCVHCDYKTKSKYEFGAHMWSKHNTEEMGFKCEHCAYRVRYKYQIEKHFSLQYETHIKCIHCNFTTRYTLCLKTHMLAHKRKRI